MYSLIIVDDEDITKVAISNYIKNKQPEFQVKGVFSNGADALEYIRSHPVDLVITDIRMPHMDGLELSRHISENHPGIITIIISGYSEFEYARKAIRYGVSTYLLKPLDFSELAENLKLLKDKLDTLHMDATYFEEDISLFFTDLIGGIITQKETLIERFSSLSLDGCPSDYKGCLLIVSLEKNGTLNHWQYGKEQLAIALLNSIRMTLTEYQTFHLFRSGMRYYFIVLSKKEIPVLSFDVVNHVLSHLLHFTCSIQIQSSFSNIEELGKFQTAGRSQALSSSNVSCNNTKPQTENDDIIIQRSMAYIKEHFADDLTREDVADAVFLSSAYFSRLFKQKAGLNFIDYLTTVRMQKAIELLATNMKVGDIAKKVGYQSRNRFFINFRQYSGYSPTEYRHQILKMETEHEKNEY
ncbi:MAG: response regulator [Roseburia sp.]|nr:response regulator [Roseburia sp.]